jgi:F-box interacting protein
MANKKNKAEEVAEPVAGSGTNYISHLPHIIITDILSRLPFKTLFICRCVSKTWLHLLLHPTFAQSYIARTPTTIILQPKNNDLQQHHLFHLDPSSNHVMFKIKTHLGIKCDQKLELVDSCNGLILLGVVYCGEVKLDRLFVCNPITAEFVTVRPCTNLTPSFVCPRIGFCPKTNVYKVVLLANRECGPEVCKGVPTLVYTLGVKGNGLWKRIKVGKDVHGVPTHSAFLNGVIHWIVLSPDVNHFIHSFDVEDECFRPVAAPLEFEEEAPKMLTWPKRRINLGVLGGCLAIGDCPFDDEMRFHIWVMKEYGVQGSWSKEWIIQFAVDAPMFSVITSRIIGLCDNGDILMLHNNNNLVSWNAANGSYKIHRIDQMDQFQALPYIPNFCSLKDVARGEPLFNATSR